MRHEESLIRAFPEHLAPNLFSMAGSFFFSAREGCYKSLTVVHTFFPIQIIPIVSRILNMILIVGSILTWLFAYYFASRVK